MWFKLPAAIVEICDYKTEGNEWSVSELFLYDIHVIVICIQLFCNIVRKYKTNYNMQ